LPIGFKSGSGIVGDIGPRISGVRIWEGIFGVVSEAGDAAKDDDEDIVGESG
jgi:hypothetical protein